MSNTMLPQRLRDTRKHRNLKQSELAELAGLQPQVISFFETGRRTPSLNSLARLADALHVTTDYLMGITDKPSSDEPNIDKHRKTVIAECKACNGTGLYKDMYERGRTAVICRECEGTGRWTFSYTPFTGKHSRTDVDRVLMRSGHVISELI